MGQPRFTQYGTIMFGTCQVYWSSANSLPGFLLGLLFNKRVLTLAFALKAPNFKQLDIQPKLWQIVAYMWASVEKVTYVAKIPA